MPHQNVALKIENFYNDEDIDLRIESELEMQSILQGIANSGTYVALYYGNHRNFILTVLLGANERGLWLDVGSSPTENKQLLLSDKVTFVSVLNNVKIQFMSYGIKIDLYEGREAFYMELPEYLLRLQRREFFRAHIPASIPVKCIIPVPQENPDGQENSDNSESSDIPAVMRELPIVDISGNGIGLLCAENEIEIIPERIFPGCQILIPDFGTLTVTIKVQTGINLTARNEVVQKRMGCYFIDLDNQMNILLQRFINHLQLESLS